MVKKRDRKDSQAGEKPIILVPQGKIRCYVHDGVFRRDTPEEHVRQRVARSLVEEYGYDKADLHLEFPIKIGSGRKKPVDITVFPEGQPHEQENIYIIVETKREDVRPSHKKQGVGQLKSYMAACINVRWGLWVASEMIALEKAVDPEVARETPFLDAADIPFKGHTEPKPPDFASLVPATEGLKATFARCHNYIHTNGNLGKEKAFFELLKLIFCKMHDEETSSGSLRFYVATEERRSELGQRKVRERIEALFNAVQGDYPYIFPDKNEKIALDNRSLAYCVGELQKFSFRRTPSDIKGEAYEEIVGVTSRRDQGAFFTPRNVCDMAVRIVFATYRREDLLDLHIIDPACGTGGFLRAALLNLRTLIEEQERAKWGDEVDKAEAHTVQRLKRLCDSHLFGIDKLDELVRAGQMNLAMHGDGSMNVFPENSLLPPGEWKTVVRENISFDSFDVLFTNPPFGSKLSVDDPHILDRFELAGFESKSERTSLPPEHLFVERCLDFLKPGGRMAIVLPDSILSNPGLLWLRQWLLRRAYVIASIDLPKVTFAKSQTGTLTSVLVLQKFTDEERRMVEETSVPAEYEVFMAIVDHVGWDNRGEPVYLRSPEGEEILRRTVRTVSSRDPEGNVVEERKEVEEPIINDQLPMVADLFERWLDRVGTQRWMR